MSNSYLQFSFALDMPTEDLREFTKDLLNNPPEDMQPDWCDPEDLVLDFEWDMHESHLYIWSEEYADIDGIVTLVQKYLAHADCPVSSVCFAYAESCSKPLVDAFGGGAVYVDKEGARYMSTYKWLADQGKSNV